MGKRNKPQKGLPKDRKREKTVDHVDHGTPELRNHHTVLKTSQRSYVLSQIPIDYYHYTKKSIDRRSYEAGVKLFEAFSRSGILPSSSPCTSPMGAVSSKKDCPLEGSLKARQEVRRALNHCGGAVGMFVVFNVVCYGLMLSELTMPHYRSPSSKMDRLKEALSDLANFYRIPHHG